MRVPTIGRWAAAVAMSLLASLGCSSEKTIEAQAAVPVDSKMETAKKAAVLFEDAKERCLSLARHAMTQRESSRDGEVRIVAGAYFATTAQPDLAVASKFRDLGFMETDKIRYALEQSLVNALDELRRIQGYLCEEVTRNWVHADSYEQRIGTSVTKFNGIWRTVDRHLLITDEDRRRILAEFAPQAEEARAHVQDRVSAQDSGSNWYEEGVVAEDPEVLMARKRASREEDEWRERQNAQRDALHRKAIEEWRTGGDAPGAMPSLGIDRGDPTADEASGGRLGRWHRGYLERSAGTRVALERYSMVRGQGSEAQRGAACRALFGATSDLLEDGRAFESPVNDIGRALKNAQQALRRTAEACLAGNAEGEEKHLAEAGGYFKHANERLAAARQLAQP